LLVYGAGAHLDDMLSWHPELAGRIERVFDSDLQKVGQTVGGTGVVIEAAEALRHVAAGRRVAVAAIRYYEEIQARITELNPDLSCAPLDRCLQEPEHVARTDGQTDTLLTGHKSQYTAVIWGTGKEFLLCWASIRRQVELGRLRLLAISPTEGFYRTIYGYPAIPHHEIRALDPDLVITAMPQQMLPSVYHAAKEVGIERRQMLRGDVFTLPDFDLREYMSLREQPISILSDNCFAGLLYHHLDLPFTTPTINMWFPAMDFVKLASDPHRYMQEDMVFDTWRWQADEKYDYPVMRIGDLHAHCNHTTSAAAAAESWNKRKKKLDYDRILSVMRAHSPAELDAFERIPGRKLCFTSFATKMPQTCFLPSQTARMELWQLENGGGYWTFSDFRSHQISVGA